MLPVKQRGDDAVHTFENTVDDLEGNLSCSMVERSMRAQTRLRSLKDCKYDPLTIRAES